MAIVLFMLTKQQAVRRLSKISKAGLQAGLYWRRGYGWFVRVRGLDGYWWRLSEAMWGRMKRDGIVRGFRACTLVADLYRRQW